MVWLQKSQLGEVMIRDLEKTVIGNCNLCQGKGFVDDIECSCVNKYRILLSLKNGGFSREFLMMALEGNLDNVVEIIEGKEYWDWALDNWEEFIEKGLGIVLCGDDLDLVSSFLIYCFLKKDFRITCCNLTSYNSDEEFFDLMVIEYNAEESVYKHLEKRKKKILSSILLLEDYSILKKDLNLSEILDFDGNKLTGIFRKIKGKGKKERTGWRI